MKRRERYLQQCQYARQLFTPTDHVVPSKNPGPISLKIIVSRQPTDPPLSWYNTCFHSRPEKCVLQILIVKCVPVNRWLTIDLSPQTLFRSLHRCNLCPLPKTKTGRCM